MIRIVLTTTDSREAASQLARALVSDGLAACVNIIPNAISVYKWEGRIEEASEFVLIIKTSERRVGDLTERIKELHHYDVPEIVVLPVATGLPAYLNWVEQACATRS